MKNTINLMLSTAVATLIIGCGSPSSTGSSTVVNNSAYIAFSPLVSARFDNLYKTDGTAANTNLVTNSVLPHLGYNYSAIENFMKDGNTVYIEIEDESLVNSSMFGRPLIYQLLKLDTTTDSLSQISNTKYTLLGTLKGFPHPKYMTSNGLFIYINPLPNTVGNYRDMEKIGSGGSTLQVINNTGYKPDYLGYSAKVGDDIYVSAFTYPLPPSTTISDYTILKLNTSLNKYEHISALDGYQMLSMVKKGDFVYFIGNTSNINLSVLRLFKYNLTTPNTPPVLVNGNISQSSNYLYAFNNSVYFVSHTATNNTTITGQVNKLDLNTNQVSTLISVPYALNDSKTFGKFVEFQNSLYLVSNHHLFKIDNSNTVNLTTSVTIPDNVVYEANGKLYFGADDGSIGTELYEYDGTNVNLVKDINLGAGSSIPRHITELNGDIVFQASQDGTNNKLFKLHNNTLTSLN